MRSCGCCKHFIKIENTSYLKGLCDKLDYRVCTDSGRRCLMFKRRRNSRPRKRKITWEDVNDGD